MRLSEWLNFLVSMPKGLTYCGLLMPYGDIGPGQHWLWEWLVADDTKPLPEPMLTYDQRCSMAFTWEKLHKKCSWTLSVTCIRRLHFQNYNHISQGPMSMRYFIHHKMSLRCTFHCFHNLMLMQGIYFTEDFSHIFFHLMELMLFIIQ